MTQQAERGWLTGRAAIAEHAGVSRRTVSRWIEEGRIPFRRLSSKLLMVRVQDLDRAIERMAQEYEAQQEGHG